MAISNQVFMTRWYDELWNNNNEDVIEEMMHPDCKAYGLGPEPVVGPGQFKKFYKEFRKEYAGIAVNIEKNFIDGDYLISLCTVKGKHNKTGNPINFLGTSIARVENGKLIEAWNCFDFLTLNIQSGKINPDQLL